METQCDQFNQSSSHTASHGRCYERDVTRKRVNKTVKTLQIRRKTSDVTRLPNC